MTKTKKTKQDWRGIKGQYYDYGYKDGCKETENRIIEIIDKEIEDYFNSNGDFSPAKQLEWLKDKIKQGEHK